MNARAPRPSERSQRGLDWLNVFIADVETGFGPFIVVSLAVNGRQQGQIGLVLTAGAVCGIASQLWQTEIGLAVLVMRLSTQTARAASPC